jgi:hypothetical protein
LGQVELTEGLTCPAEGEEVLEILGRVYLLFVVVEQDELGNVGDDV